MKINTSSVSTPEFWVRSGSTRVENERHQWSRNDLHTRWCAVQNKEITLKAGFFVQICHAKRVATCLQISQPFHELKLVKFLAFHILTWSLEKVPFTDGAFPFRPLREARSRDPRTPKGKAFKATNLSAQIQVQWLCEKRRQQSTYVDHKRHYGDGLLRKNKQTNKSNVSVKSKPQHAPPPGNPPGIWLFRKLLFKFPPTRTKMPFKCPTLGSIQVIKCPHPGDISQAQKWQKDGGNAFNCRTKSL